MPFDADKPAPPETPVVSSRLTYADLNADQRARFGAYVKAKDDARREMDSVRRERQRAAAALEACGGDKGAAFRMLLAGMGLS